MGREESRERGGPKVNAWADRLADAWVRFRDWRRRRGELLRREQERALAREAARARAAFANPGEGAVRGRLVVRWGLPSDETKIAELLELNGMPRWVAFEERFVVAAKPDGRVLAALRYREEPERLLLGLLVSDPRGRGHFGERRLAVALHAGAGELAREMGVREVLTRSAAFGDDPRGAKYRRGDRYRPLEAG